MFGGILGHSWLHSPKLPRSDVLLWLRSFRFALGLQKKSSKLSLISWGRGHEQLDMIFPKPYLRNLFGLRDFERERKSLVSACEPKACLCRSQSFKGLRWVPGQYLRPRGVDRSLDGDDGLESVLEVVCRSYLLSSRGRKSPPAARSSGATAARSSCTAGQEAQA